MKNRILWKLTACFAAVLLLFTAVLGSVFVIMFRRHTISINHSALEAKAVTIAATLSSFETGRGGYGMGHGGYGGYGAYLRFLNDLAMAEVWIVDENLNQLIPVHGHSASYSKLPENAETIVAGVFDGNITYDEDSQGLLSAPALTVGAPIRSDNGISAAVLLHSPASGVNEAVMQSLSTLVLGIAAALLCAGLAAYLLSYRFTAPLRRMKTAALRLADGDFTVRTGVTQYDEIGQLAQTMDLLANRLASAEQERDALDQLKQDLVANVSHELRTPVAVLRGSLELLQDGTIHQADEVAGYYAHMLAESRQLERLVNDLLELSRLQDAQFHLEMAEINLCDVVRDSQRAIRRSLLARNLELTVQCPQEECIIAGDYGRIRQLLMILLDNAVKFSPEGRTIEVRLQECGDKYTLTVRNDGNTIDPEELPHIFDRFYRTRLAGKVSGTGLGLAIAKQIAERHDAAITVESTQEQTVFTVSFRHN